MLLHHHGPGLSGLTRSGDRNHIEASDGFHHVRGTLNLSEARVRATYICRVGFGPQVSICVV